MNTKYFLPLYILLTFCFACKSDRSKNMAPSATVSEPNYKIIATFPHDPEAFTQGLVIINETLIEGTGLNGKSWISTYESNSLDYDKKVILPKEFFGEGLTLLNHKIYQLTYKSQIGFVYDSESFQKIKTFEYPNPIIEGWGITHNNEDLILSDGSSTLYFLDTVSFQIRKKIRVKQNGTSVSALNELEYVEGSIFANVWNTNLILKINPSNGDVQTVYDLSTIVKMEKSKHPKIDVLNGIAYDKKRKSFIITGKYWYNYYRIKLDTGASIPNQ